MKDKKRYNSDEHKANHDGQCLTPDAPQKEVIADVNPDESEEQGAQVEADEQEILNLNQKLEEAQAQVEKEKKEYLFLMAEFDNFRKRTQREKDGIYQDAVADTVKKFLPVYDNLERALHHETADEAYKKGVEMTLTELVKILDALGVKPFGEAGETFDPQRHNAVMHIEDESLGENVIAEVFQTGFAHGDKVIRFAMVKVAN